MTPDTQLTEAEARVLWTTLHHSYAPGQYANEWKSAMDKLGRLGHGFACRDCPEPGKLSSHYGGLVCVAHKREEDHRFALAEEEARKTQATEVRNA